MTTWHSMCVSGWGRLAPQSSELDTQALSARHRVSTAEMDPLSDTHHARPFLQQPPPLLSLRQARGPGAVHLATPRSLPVGGSGGPPTPLTQLRAPSLCAETACEWLQGPLALPPGTWSTVERHWHGLSDRQGITMGAPIHYESWILPSPVSVVAVPSGNPHARSMRGVVLYSALHSHTIT